MKLSYVSLCLTMVLLVPCAASEQKNNAWYKKAALYVAAPLAVVGAAAYATWYYKNARSTERLENDKDTKPISQNKQELLKIWYSPAANRIKSWFSLWSWEQWLHPKK